MGMKITFDKGALDVALSAMEADVSAAVRPAAQAGAQVVYEAVQRNVAAIGTKTGNLRRAIYQAFSADNSEDGIKATYHISWNKRKAPHGYLVEYGHIQRYKVIIGRDGKFYTDKKHPLPSPKHVAAQPFLRPAIAVIPNALGAAETEFFRSLNEGPLKVKP